MAARTTHLVRPPYGWWNAQSAYPSSTAQSNTPPSLTPCATIDFLHPGYDDPADILFSLPANDIATNSTTPGVHHGTALTACRIIASNRPGRLSASRVPPSTTDVPHPWDYVLTERRYYFHPDLDNDAPIAGPYPITPDFRSWRFPHRNLPAEWNAPYSAPPTAAASSYMSVKVIERDGFCRVTGARDGLNCSHVIPKEELSWFATNSMSTYNTNTLLTQSHVINDTSNGFALRSDLNGPAFDAGRFVVVPKEGRLVLHFILPTSELAYLFHNRELYPVDTIPREFLYARFAWGVFRLLRRFLASEKFLVVAMLVRSVWTYRTDYMRWGQTTQQKEASKRKRGGDAGGAGTGGGTVVDDMVDVEPDHCTQDDGNPESRGSIDSPEWLHSPSPLPLEPSMPLPLQHQAGARSLSPDIEDLKPIYLRSPAHEQMLDRFEIDEDLRIQHEIFPEMETGYVARDIAFYPGHRRVERMKRRLRRNREWVQVLAGEAAGEDRTVANRRRAEM